MDFLADVVINICSNFFFTFVGKALMPEMVDDGDGVGICTEAGTDISQ